MSSFCVIGKIGWLLCERERGRVEYGYNAVNHVIKLFHGRDFVCCCYICTRDSERVMIVI